jgi:cytochrome c556
MFKAIIIACLTVSVLAACGPAEGEKQIDGKEFMKSLNEECERCGKVKINVFGGEAK